MDLWHEDVFEVFLWTGPAPPIYLEYEISPLNHELPDPDSELRRSVPRLASLAFRARASDAEGDQHHGRAEDIRRCDRGMAGRVLHSLCLMKPLQNVPPKAGTEWRANFYRMDYDDGKVTQWDWARVGQSFHEYDKFGVLRFADR